MPSPYIKKLAKSTGKSEKELEKLWKEAKKITSETLGVDINDFDTKEYKYAVGVVKNMVGVKEAITDPSVFLKSDKSANEFIEDMVTSGDFSIGNVIPPKKKKKDDEEEDEEENEEEEEETLDKESTSSYTIKKEDQSTFTQTLYRDDDSENTKVEEDSIEALDKALEDSL